jgi:hypothetical protein
VGLSGDLDRGGAGQTGMTAWFMEHRIREAMKEGAARLSNASRR